MYSTWPLAVAVAFGIVMFVICVFRMLSSDKDRPRNAKLAARAGLMTIVVLFFTVDPSAVVFLGNVMRDHFVWVLLAIGVLPFVIAPAWVFIEEALTNKKSKTSTVRSQEDCP